MSVVSTQRGEFAEPTIDQGSLTWVYTRTHAAFKDAGAWAGIRPFAARIVLAIADRGGSTTPEQLAEDLATDGSAVRRCLAVLYARGLATGVGADGGERRIGVMTTVGLTDDGRKLARRIRRCAKGDAK